MSIKDYREQEWLDFREQIKEDDEYACQHCGRGEDDDVVLQVHHTEYIEGRKPWEYPTNLCKTLCKGCHAIEHGKIMPRDGWIYLWEEDLEDLVGNCDLCNTKIRYVHYIWHPHWPEQMGFGTVCCDDFTGKREAHEGKKKINRRKNFLIAPSGSR